MEVKAIPGASRDEICGWHGTALKIRTTAPPQAGQANTRIIQLLAAHLGIPVSSIQLLKGHTSPHKLLLINAASTHPLPCALHNSDKGTSKKEDSRLRAKR